MNYGKWKTCNLFIDAFNYNSYINGNKFDFKTYKISVKDEGKTTLNDKDVNYKGEALQCSIFIKRTNAEDDDLLFNSTAERPVYVWIGYKQKMPFVAKIEIDSTPLGRLKAYTTEVNVKD